ncbi:MAG TPA: lytic transglycosylase domain-containing protein, partial [Burkholderiaceae bacterium]|nr:lytic transglycosylase domain-containing protein [Burkholderiaceae bacterium]
ALQLIAIGLRNEGVREWNFTLRGMSERELFAAAELACEREVWDRCINTSDRTRQDIDMAQRYPMPFRDIVLARSQETGLDPAYVFGLIRQESRFIPDARSNVGAAGLMQLMPNTARWVARKLALDFKPDQIVDPLVNVKLGTGYLKLVLDDFGGSQAMAAAAYNAGPNRPRRWREGPAVEPAIWAENIPYNETRDYVRKVLSNAAVYASLLTGSTLSLKSWLGAAAIGPRDVAAPVVDVDLP